MKRLLTFVFTAITFLGFASDIAVVTLAIGENYQKAVQLGMENKQHYCALHGYDFIYGKESLEPTRPPHWSKILLILDVMEKSDCKWIFWSDADSLFMNFAIPLEDLIDERFNLIISRETQYTDLVLNSGEFLIKNCEWSRQFLKQVYSHKEFIHTMWEENSGFIAELKKTEWSSLAKFIHQRFLNSYLVQTGIGYKFTLDNTFQKGDFILHFAGIASSRGLNSLSEFFREYSSLVINDPKIPSLDQYLGIYGFQLSPMNSSKNEGYMTKAQSTQFGDFLQQHPEIETMAQIGLNGGHSAEFFIKNSKNFKEFFSFDNNIHPYTKAAVEYLSQHHKNRFHFIQGDSKELVPEFSKQFPDKKFDLIYIDGNHSYDYVIHDINNMKKMASQKTILLVDDFLIPSVHDAILDCQKRGIIQLNSTHSSFDPIGGERIWVEASYIFKD